MVKLYQAEKGGRLDGVAGLAASAPTVPVIVDSSLSLYPFFLLSAFLLSLSLSVFSVISTSSVSLFVSPRQKHRGKGQFHCSGLFPGQ